MAIKRCPADAAFSDAIRLNQNYVCEHCHISGGRKGGGLPQMECAHIYGRSNKVVRWDILNALCLCHTCHRNFTGNPLDFESWLDSYFGQGYLDILNEKRRGILKTNKALRLEIGMYYRGEVKRLESGGADLVSYI